jgi:hypothetical protein
MQIISIGKTDWYKGVQNEKGEIVYFGTEKQCELFIRIKG